MRLISIIIAESTLLILMICCCRVLLASLETLDRLVSPVLL